MDDLIEMTTPHFAATIAWAMMNDGTIDNQCLDELGMPAPCRMDSSFTDAQQKIAETVANYYKRSLPDQNALLQFSTYYDETWGFMGRGIDFFDGLGQSELIATADIFERAGLVAG